MNWFVLLVPYMTVTAFGLGAGLFYNVHIFSPYYVLDDAAKSPLFCVMPIA